MTSLFKPKVNIPDAPAAPPTVDEAARAQDYGDRIRRRRGRQSTILVPDQAGKGAAQMPPPSTVLGG